MKKIIVLQGCPCSGKTTFAKEYASKHDNVKIVCRDDIRIKLGNGQYTMKFEDEVNKIELKEIKSGLKNNLTVIIDATNLNKKTINKWKNLAKELKSEIIFKEFYVPFKIACERDKNSDRNHVCGVSVLKRFYEKYYKEKYESETIQTIYHERIKIDKKLKPAIICDIDGTVAWMQGRSPYNQKEVLNDMPDIRMFQLLEYLHKSGVEIIFISGREGTKQCKEDTIKWLNKYFKPKKYFFSFKKRDNFKLFMRQKGDYRPDEIIKKELFDNYILEHYDVICVFDDRNKVIDMWRENKLLTCQVEQGDF